MPGLTLLWALRSPCNLGCRYCYFGTIEEHRQAPPTDAGSLSHLSRDDLPADELIRFASTLGGSAVDRVFLAGGDPLIWPPILDLIAVLKDAGAQVVICTNGIPLNRTEISHSLVAVGVDAVSVSLDSADPTYNDTWRPARNRRDGWRQVITGIRTLLDARSAQDTQRGNDGGGGPAVGLYSVITARNLDDIVAVPELAADLGLDYAVPQPISLAADHPLHTELALTPDHMPTLGQRLDALYDAELPLHLPAAPYPGQVAAAVTSPTGLVRGCFGGHTLFFIEPDGTIWDCPSTLRIAATPPQRRRTIRGGDAADLFPAPDGCAQDCALFSVDCVNMWPLMDFQQMLAPRAARSTP